MIRISILAALMFCTATAADAADDLYSAQTVVTGQGEANRTNGFASCLEDVLIKVSGAVKLAGDPRLSAYQSRAGDFVKAHTYHDQMSGTPIRDEQGTRDRPYDLIVEFDEKKIDDLLKILGVTPWLSHRPVLAVFVAMELGANNYIVTADAGLSAVAPRQSLLAASTRRGMTIVLPDVAALAKSGLDAAALAKMPALGIDRACHGVRRGGRPGRANSHGTILNLPGPASGRWNGRAGRIAGKSAGPPSTTPSAAPSAAPRKSCRAMVIPDSMAGRRISQSAIALRSPSASSVWTTFIYRGILQTQLRSADRSRSGLRPPRAGRGRCRQVPPASTRATRRVALGCYDRNNAK